ncbi:hypothetical protein M885DRAFT_514866 [Pelagophyceae sp. CCMP2097]|nr:hypothetical protein M885DRAFT_514866 [Pelagophyceae sp. CCMP2097]
MFGRRSARGPKPTRDEEKIIKQVEKLIDQTTSSVQGRDQFKPVSELLRSADATEAVQREAVRHLRKVVQGKDERAVLLALMLAGECVAAVPAARRECGGGVGGKKFCDAVLRVAQTARDARLRTKARELIDAWALAHAAEQRSVPYFMTAKIELDALIDDDNAPPATPTTAARVSTAATAFGVAPEGGAYPAAPAYAEPAYAAPAYAPAAAASFGDDAGLGDDAHDDSRLIQRATSIVEALRSMITQRDFAGGSGVDDDVTADVSDQCEAVLAVVRARIQRTTGDEAPGVVEGLFLASDQLQAAVEDWHAPPRPRAPPAAAEAFGHDGGVSTSLDGAFEHASGDGQAQAPPQPPPEEDLLLLPGWTPQHTEDGKAFFAHEESGVTQWEPPLAPAATSAADDFLSLFGTMDAAPAATTAAEEPPTEAANDFLRGAFNPSPDAEVAPAVDPANPFATRLVRSDAFASENSFVALLPSTAGLDGAAAAAFDQGRMSPSTFEFGDAAAAFGDASASTAAFDDAAAAFGAAQKSKSTAEFDDAAAAFGAELAAPYSAPLPASSSTDEFNDAAAAFGAAPASPSAVAFDDAAAAFAAPTMPPAAPDVGPAADATFTDAAAFAAPTPTQPAASAPSVVAPIAFALSVPDDDDPFAAFSALASPVAEPPHGPADFDMPPVEIIPAAAAMPSPAKPSPAKRAATPPPPDPPTAEAPIPPDAPADDAHAPPWSPSAAWAPAFEQPADPSSAAFESSKAFEPSDAFAPPDAWGPAFAERASSDAFEPPEAFEPPTAVPFSARTPAPTAIPPADSPGPEAAFAPSADPSTAPFVAFSPDAVDASSAALPTPPPGPPPTGPASAPEATSRPTINPRTVLSSSSPLPPIAPFVPCALPAAEPPHAAIAAATREELPPAPTFQDVAASDDEALFSANPFGAPAEPQAQYERADEPAVSAAFAAPLAPAAEPATAAEPFGAPLSPGVAADPAPQGDSPAPSANFEQPVDPVASSASEVAPPPPADDDDDDDDDPFGGLNRAAQPTSALYVPSPVAARKSAAPASEPAPPAPTREAAAPALAEPAPETVSEPPFADDQAAQPEAPPPAPPAAPVAVDPFAGLAW